MVRRSIGRHPICASNPCDRDAAALVTRKLVEPLKLVTCKSLKLVLKSVTSRSSVSSKNKPLLPSSEDVASSGLKLARVGSAWANNQSNPPAFAPLVHLA